MPMAATTPRQQPDRSTKQAGSVLNLCIDGDPGAGQQAGKSESYGRHRPWFASLVEE